jgi:oligopeptide transport system permease protein
MKSYILKRLLQFPLILAIIYLVTFLMVWVVPGDPFQNSDRAMDPQTVQRLKEQYNMDTWYNFLLHYPVRLVTEGDFGPSLHQRQFTINELIRDRWPVSIVLGLVALVIAVSVGLVVGTLSAVYRDGIVDWVATTLTLVGISVPAFVTAAVLLLLFVGRFQWFELSGSGANAGLSLSQLVLPALALSLAPMAYIVRLQRVSMLDVLGADFVRTARAKGLAKPWVVIKHCLRNAFLPVLSYLGPAAALTLTGSFVVERVFGLNGLGQTFVDSVTNRDQTMILALVMIYSSLVLLMNLIVDLLYGVIDPRIDVAGGGAK